MKNYHNLVLKSLVIAFNISVAKVHSTVHFYSTAMLKNIVLQTPGFNSQVMEWVLKKAQKLEMPAIGYLGGICLDEMNVAKQ